MDIDTRLEKLAERHEALTQTVELLVAEQRESNVKWDRRFEQIAKTLEHLVRIAENHEHRLDSLEG